MRRRAIVLGAVLAVGVLLLVVAALAAANRATVYDNHDPRVGRVYFSHSYDSKLCVGPDLLVNIAVNPAHSYWVRKSPECTP